MIRAAGPQSLSTMLCQSTAILSEYVDTLRFLEHCVLLPKGHAFIQLQVIVVNTQSQFDSNMVPSSSLSLDWNFSYCNR